MTTTCCSSTANIRRHVIKGVFYVIGTCLFLGLILACVVGVIDYLRLYNTQALMFPFAPIPPGQRFLAVGITASRNAELGQAWFDQFVSWYNIAFPGGCRLGSGIGLIAGAFWALFRIDRNCLHERVAAGTTAGAIVGSRLLLMFSGNAVYFFSFMLLGAIIVGWYMRVWGGQPKVPNLPIVSGIQSQPLS